MNFNPQYQAFEPDIHGYLNPRFSPGQGFNLSFSPRPPYQEGHDILRQLFTPSPCHGLPPPSSTGISNGLLYQSFAPFSPSWRTDSANQPQDQFRSSFPSLLSDPNTAVDDFGSQFPPQGFHDEEVRLVETLVAQPSSQEPNPKRPRKNISQWEKHKDQIKKLYLDEGKSVEETRDCMREQYGFDASWVLSLSKLMATIKTYLEIGPVHTRLNSTNGASSKTFPRTGQIGCWSKLVAEKRRRTRILYSTLEIGHSQLIACSKV